MTLSITAIHQFHHGVDVGDGVTNSLLFIQRLLQQMGFDSEIFAVNMPPAMANRVRPHLELERIDSEHTLLLHHHSLGHDLGDWLSSLELPRALVYHNITPASFFSPGSVLHHYSVLGHKQLLQWRNEFRAVLAVSEFNAEDLIAMGYSKDAIATIPLLVDLERQAEVSLASCTPAEQLHPSLNDRPVLLFVGRLVENKRQHLLLEALWHLHHLQRQHAGDMPRPMLVLAGGGQMSEYAQFLHQRMHQLGLDDSVIIPGKVADGMLQALYQQSDAFVCASAHEGFGMPLVEAMRADCPVVAMGCTNVPHTMGEGGLVLESEDPAAMAASLLLLLTDDELKKSIIAGQRRALARYRPDVLAAALREWLTSELSIELPQ